MTLSRIKEMYPIGSTYVGQYSQDGSFTITAASQVEDIINDPHYPPFYEERSALPFVHYVGNGKFECWAFLYFKVKGYLTTDGENFLLATHEDDFNWDPVDPADSDDYSILELDWNEWNWYWNYLKGYLDYGCHQHRVEQAAKRFDIEEYVSGRIITDADELREFCQNLAETGEIEF